MKKTAFALVFVLSLAFSFLAAGILVQTAELQFLPTVYVRPDGSVDGTNKIQREGDVYTFADDLFVNIVVENDNIIIDGNGFKLQGTGFGVGNDPGIGIDLSYAGNASFTVGNVTVRNLSIQNFTTGILAGGNNLISGDTIIGNLVGINLNGDDCHIYRNRIIDNDIAISSNGRNVIYGNTMTDNDCGIQGTSRYSPIIGNNISNTGSDAIVFSYSNNNTISQNTITNSGRAAIYFIYCWDNDISENNIMENDRGIDFFFDGTASYNNTIVSNNFVNNGVQVLNGNVSVNTWDKGTSGNYWSDYQTKYPHAKEIGSTGMGDTAYIINAENKDNYPLIKPIANNNPPLPTPSPNPTPTPSPTPEPEPFPAALVIAAVVLVAVATIAVIVVVCAGLLVYFKKRKR